MLCIELIPLAVLAYLLGSLVIARAAMIHRPKWAALAVPTIVITVLMLVALPYLALTYTPMSHDIFGFWADWIIFCVAMGSIQFPATVVLFGVEWVHRGGRVI